MLKGLNTKAKGTGPKSAKKAPRASRRWRNYKRDYTGALALLEFASAKMGGEGPINVDRVLFIPSR